MLCIEHLYKRLGEFQLKDINLQINEGEYFVILGPTGTGKTVILEVIAGMYKPDSGNLFLHGKNLINIPPEKRNIGFVYQDYALFPHLSVKENIVFGLKAKRISKKEIKEKLDEIVSMFKIEHLLSRYPGNLSGGEQQRVAIARALITLPKILLMDEPLSSLDPSTKIRFQNMFKEVHNRMGTTTIHITHDFNEALYLADRIAVMKSGTIVQVGTPNEIFKRPNSTFVANFIGMENIFKGKVKGNRTNLSSNVNIEVKTDKKGYINLAIRAEDVLVAKKLDNLNCRNKFCGRITNVIYQGPLCKLDVDIGIELTSLISAKSFENMEIRLGDIVEVAVEDRALHIF